MLLLKKSTELVLFEKNLIVTNCNIPEIMLLRTVEEVPNIILLDR